MITRRPNYSFHLQELQKLERKDWEESIKQGEGELSAQSGFISSLHRRNLGQLEGLRPDWTHPYHHSETVAWCVISHVSLIYSCCSKLGMEDLTLVPQLILPPGYLVPERLNSNTSLSPIFSQSGLLLPRCPLLSHPLPSQLGPWCQAGCRGWGPCPPPAPQLLPPVQGAARSSRPLARLLSCYLSSSWSSSIAGAASGILRWCWRTRGSAPWNVQAKQEGWDSGFL